MLKTFARVLLIVFPFMLLGYLIGKHYQLYFLDAVLCFLIGMYISSLVREKEF